VNSPIRKSAALLLALAGQVALSPEALACAACFGQSDDKMAQGMNAGIFALLGVVTMVLGGFLAFMVFLVRRASTHSWVMDRRAEEIRLQMIKEQIPVGS
jgi:hypothetical protein